MEAPYQFSKFDESYVELHTLIQCLFKKKWWIACVSITTCFLAMLYCFFAPVQYQATALLQVHHKQDNSLGSITPSANDNLTTEPLSVQIALMRSKFILAPVIKSLGLDTPAKKRSPSEMINEIRSHLTIVDLSGSAENSNNPGILQLSLTGSNPGEIMQIINNIALTTKEKDKERKTVEAENTLEFLYQELPTIQTSLKDAEAKLNFYRATSGKIDGKLQKEYLLTHLSDIDKKLETIRLKKVDMSQQFTSYHPFIIALNQQHNELVKQRYEILKKIQNLPATDQIAATLERDVNVKNNMYTLLLNKIHQQQLITAGIVSDISILSLATYADKLFPLRLPIISGASLLVGFLLGCLGVLVWQLNHNQSRLRDFQPNALSEELV